MNAPLPPDPLEAALARPPYLDDAGFTARVVAALPAPRRRGRTAVLAAGGLLSTGVGALLLAQLAPGLGPALAGAFTGAAPRGDGVAALAVMAALLATGAIALRPEPGHRSRTSP